MERERIVSTSDGEIRYTLIKKRIKNLNLRLRAGGTVVLSVPMGCTPLEADGFIRQKSGWIATQTRRMRERPAVELMPECGRAVCFERLTQSLDRVYPLVASYGVERPVLKIRKMRSQWGNCHWMQGYITLNTALHRCPERLRDYVALHELVHFLYQDHGSGFYGAMDRLMPDWRERRRELKKYAAAILD